MRLQIETIQMAQQIGVFYNQSMEASNVRVEQSLKQCQTKIQEELSVGIKQKLI